MTKQDKSNDNDEKPDAEDKAGKKEKVAEKLEAMGVMPTEKKEEEESSSSKLFPVLMVLLIAAPVIAAVIYFQMPDEVARFLSFDDDAQTSDNQSQAYPQYNRSNQMLVSSQPQPGQQFTGLHPGQQQYAGQYPGHQPPAWDNTQNASQQNASQQMAAGEVPLPDPDDYMLNRSNTILVEKPQWVKNREAEIEQQRQQLQQQLNRQQQAMLEQQQQMIRQHQAWAGLQARPYSGGTNNGNTGQVDNAMNMPPGSENVYAYNPYMQQNPYWTNPSQPIQRPYYQPYNQPPQAFYYNHRPYSGHHPYAGPYGWGGPVYR